MFDDNRGVTPAGIAIIVVSWFLFTAGMACFGLVFLSYLQDALERAELTDPPQHLFA